MSKNTEKKLLHITEDLSLKKFLNVDNIDKNKYDKNDLDFHLNKELVILKILKSKYIDLNIELDNDWICRYVIIKTKNNNKLFEIGLREEYAKNGKYFEYRNINELFKTIDRKIKDDDYECGICLLNKKSFISCKKCYNKVCFKCYKKINTCAFCRKVDMIKKYNLI